MSNSKPHTGSATKGNLLQAELSYTLKNWFQSYQALRLPLHALLEICTVGLGTRGAGPVAAATAIQGRPQDLDTL